MACEELVRRFELEGDDFLTRLVTGDETLVHYHISEAKRATMEWYNSSPPKRKHVSDTAPCREIMPTPF